MKNTITSIASLVMILTISITLNAQQKTINTETSKLVWKGHKVTGTHQGVILFKKGLITFKDNLLTKGTFLIDMTTLENTDLSGEYKGKLERHLKSDDFFGIEKFPTAKLVFNKITVVKKNEYKIKADLTIKGITNEVIVQLSTSKNKAIAILKIDRTKYNIRYGSPSFFDNLKDKAIYDEFDVEVALMY